MKKIITIIFNLIISTIIVYAQAPQSFNYTGIALDSKDKAITNKTISVQAVIDDGAGGSYVETHTVGTDNNGFFSIKIGGDFPGSITGIDLTAPTAKTLTIAIDPDGGSNYTYLEPVQLSSVPFAIYGEDEDADPENEIQELTLTESQLILSMDGGEVDLTSFENTDNQLLKFEDESGLLGISNGNTVDLNSLSSDLTLEEMQEMIGELTVLINNKGDQILAAIAEIGTNQTSGNMMDIDGNEYTWIKIGNQTWMAKNLKTTKYRNGDLIGTTSPTTLDIEGEDTPKYQWAYDGNESNVATYGRFYTWYTVTDSRGVCPTGWHVPSDGEWETLVIYLGGEDIAGGKLKEPGTSHWENINFGASNETGFTALPGGKRDANGSFNNVGFTGYWWSNAEDNTDKAWYRSMYGHLDDLHKHDDSKKLGSSVRCVKD